MNSHLLIGITRKALSLTTKSERIRIFNEIAREINSGGH
jgi:hypothetical protein